MWWTVNDKAQTERILSDPPWRNATSGNETITEQSHLIKLSSQKTYIPRHQTYVLERSIRHLRDISQNTPTSMPSRSRNVFIIRTSPAPQTTHMVIGMMHRIGHEFELPVLDLTPQKIKQAYGLEGRAKKTEMVKIAQALLRHDFRNHHLVDAAFAGVAGILHLRSEKCHAQKTGEDSRSYPILLINI